MKLRLTRLAAQDIAGIADFIREHNPDAAGRVRAALLEALQTLTAFPALGRPQSVTGVRKLVARKYPYLIYYSVDETANEIVVLTIQHPSRDRPG